MIAGILDRLNGSECFIVILTIDNIDVIILLEQRAHDFLALCLSKFSRHLRQKIPAIGDYRILQALGPADLRGCTDRSLNIDNM